MSDDSFDADALIDAMSAYLDLPVLPAYRDGIRFHLATARAIAADVLEFPLADDAEPAPVFTP